VDTPGVARSARSDEEGLDHVYIHQVGPDQAGFLRFAERELLGSTTAASAR
jgi:hypothetical protein